MGLFRALVLSGLFVAISSVPLAQKPRSFGNFGPQLSQSFNVLKPQEQLVFNSADAVASALEFFNQKFNAVAQVSSSHKAHNGVTHVYLQQVINGIQVVNGVGNVNVGPSGQILSFGSSFFAGQAPSTAIKASKTSADAHAALAKLLKIRSLEPISDKYPAALKYIQVNSGAEVVLAWDIVVVTKQNMYNAVVDANTNEVVQLIDWVSDASYNVFPLGVNDPNSGDRAIVQDPAHLEASPLGWHAQSETETFTDTIGNNVYAQENHDGGDDYINIHRPDGGNALIFDHPLDLTDDPLEYTDAAITNLFYWNNIIHDLFYVYGFDESSGNFQDNNFGNGGAGNDAVIARAQDGLGMNNAMFATPPDGQSGVMYMFLWDQTNPNRDGSFDSGIMIHEYLHGISIRLTGGPNNVGCLRDGEGGGMGEGWGDIFGTITRVSESGTREDDYFMADYVFGGTGIRNFAYSTSFDVNPSTYSYVARPGYNCPGCVHAKGEVWAVILYEVFWNLVDKHGFSSDWFNNEGENLAGNKIFFQLLVDGMKLQPCNPTFIDARDAIIEADEINNNGENVCDIWRGFAKRGLGVDADFPGVDGFNVPEQC